MTRERESEVVDRIGQYLYDEGIQSGSLVQGKGECLQETEFFCEHCNTHYPVGFFTNGRFRPFAIKVGLYRTALWISIQKPIINTRLNVVCWHCYKKSNRQGNRMYIPLYFVLARLCQLEDEALRRQKKVAQNRKFRVLSSTPPPPPPKNISVISPGEVIYLNERKLQGRGRRRYNLKKV